EGGEPRRFEGARKPRPNRPNRAQMSDRIVVLEGRGESHGDYKAADKAIDYLQRYRDKPFFLCCGFTKPHSPLTAPQECFDRYDLADVPLPPDFATTPAAPPGFPEASITRNGDLFIGREASPEQAREMIRAYWASLSFTDDNVGRVIAELDRLNLRDKTIIVFWGDHGYHLGEKGKWSKHGSLYEIGTRVPLIIIAPDAAGNEQVSSRIVEAVDLYPTLVELCGLTPPEGLEGHSLVPLLNDPQAEWNHPAYTVHGSSEKLRGIAVRTQRYRYARYGDGPGEEMLIDIEADPHELRNLAADPKFQKVRDEHARLLREFLRKTE
ncbi:MAG: sulfatase-like hydrolase/transferase, partial [Planctomycetaceae bacterium]